MALLSHIRNYKEVRKKKKGNVNEREKCFNMFLYKRGGGGIELVYPNV